jgi:vacuolar-type H+-ATPase subunit B/Vma2
VTIVGAVSPAGGNFEEPVTQATLKVVSAFLGLSRKRSDERKYPAIDPLDSWSLYLKQLQGALGAKLDPRWVEMVEAAQAVLRRGAEVGKMMTVVGEEGVSLDDLVAYLKAEMLDAVYLQQNAFDEVDQATPIERQVRDFKPFARPRRALRAAGQGRSAALLRRSAGRLLPEELLPRELAGGRELRRRDRGDAAAGGRRMIKTYNRIANIVGDIAELFATGVAFGELAQITNPNGETSLAQVIRIDREKVSVQVFAGSKGLSNGARVRFLGRPMEVPFADALLGRIFNGSGQPIDGKPPLSEAPPIEIAGPSVNPVRRILPRNFIETRVPMIDVFNPLVVSQKLPIFSQPGEPYNELLARVGLQARGHHHPRRHRPCPTSTPASAAPSSRAP